MNPFRELKGTKTLLVDDDELIRDSLNIAFTNKGCFMRTTETAEDGLRALEEESFDIIISDFKLPGIDGLEFLRLVAASYPNTVRVLITAYGDTYVASEATAVGAYDFIEKPFSVKTLAETLALSIEARAKERHVIESSKIVNLPK